MRSAHKDREEQLHLCGAVLAPKRVLNSQVNSSQ